MILDQRYVSHVAAGSHECDSVDRYFTIDGTLSIGGIVHVWFGYGPRGLLDNIFQ
jgi:hypothetical protein